MAEQVAAQHAHQLLGALRQAPDEEAFLREQLKELDDTVLNVWRTMAIAVLKQGEHQLANELETLIRTVEQLRQEAMQKEQEDVPLTQAFLGGEREEMAEAAKAWSEKNPIVAEAIRIASFGHDISEKWDMQAIQELPQNMPELNPDHFFGAIEAIEDPDIPAEVANTIGQSIFALMVTSHAGHLVVSLHLALAQAFLRRAGGPISEPFFYGNAGFHLHSARQLVQPNDPNYLILQQLEAVYPNFGPEGSQALLTALELTRKLALAPNQRIFLYEHLEEFDESVLAALHMRAQVARKLGYHESADSYEELITTVRQLRSGEKGPLEGKEEADHALMDLARQVKQNKISLDQALEDVQQPKYVTTVDESQLSKLVNYVVDLMLSDRLLAWILARLLDTIAPYVAGPRLQAYCALRVGRLGRGSGYEALALERLQHALTLFRTLGVNHREEEGYVLLRIGNVLAYQRLNDDALASYEEALALFRDISDQYGEANVLFSKGDLLEAQNKRDEALLCYESALAIYRTERDNLMEANTLFAIGCIYAFQNKVEKALTFYNDALALYRTERDQLGEANSLMRIGELQANPDQRLELHQQALKLFREVGDRLGEAQSLFRIADIQLSKEEYEEALAFYEQALTLYRAVGDRYGEADVFLMQGHVRASQRRHDEALVSYNEALKLFRSAGIDWGQITSHWALGKLFRKQEASQKAHEEYHKALIIIEGLRHLQQWEGSRRHLTAHMAGYYQEMVELCLDMKRLNEAWHWAERGKGRTMLDLLGSARPRLETSEQRDLYCKWKCLEQKMFKLNDRLEGQPFDTPRKTAQRAELAKKRQEEAQKRQELLRLLDQGRELIQVDVPQPKELANSLRHLAHAASRSSVRRHDSRPLLVEYFFLGADRYAVFLLPLWQEAPELLVHSEKLPSGTVQQVMDHFMAGLRAAREKTERKKALKLFPALPEKVGQAFVQPWANKLSKLDPTELILVPHGPLHRLPLHAATLTDGSLLIEQYPLVYLPNAAMAGTLVKRRQADHKPTKRLIMGPPGTDLEYSEMESKQLAKAWKLKKDGQPYIHSKMKIEVLQQPSEEGLELLHLSTHSIFDFKDYLQSHILFHNERLTLMRLISDETIDLRGLRLCYLSSCESGIAHSDGGDELQGLVWSLMYAGANAVMASLWPVNDKAGLRMAQRFYYYSTKKRRSLIEAYRLALRDLRKDKEFENPFFWAPFVLFGNGWQKMRR